MRMCKKEQGVVVRSWEMQPFVLSVLCLCSQDKENRPVFVALHKYEATQPEDLEFGQGDVITVLSKGKD